MIELKDKNGFWETKTVIEDIVRDLEYKNKLLTRALKEIRKSTGNRTAGYVLDMVEGVSHDPKIERCSICREPHVLYFIVKSQRYPGEWKCKICGRNNYFEEKINGK